MAENVEIRCSYILPYRDHPDHYTNLLTVLRFIKDLPAEVIVVEQDDEERLKLPFPWVRKVFIYSPHAFNRSWALNVGALSASSEYLVFADADLLMCLDTLLYGITCLESGCDAVSPYSSVIDLTLEETKRTLSGLPSGIQREGRGFINFAGGILLMRREAFETVGGWCEEFTGWGGEDNFMSWKIHKWLRWKKVESVCYHLWHKKNEPDPSLYNLNLSIFNRLENYGPTAVVNWICYSGLWKGDKDRFSKRFLPSGTAIIEVCHKNDGPARNVLSLTLPKEGGGKGLKTDKEALLDIIRKNQVSTVVFKQANCFFHQAQWNDSLRKSAMEGIPVFLFDGTVIQVHDDFHDQIAGREPIPLGRDITAPSLWGGIALDKKICDQETIDFFEKASPCQVRGYFGHAGSVPGACLVKEEAVFQERIVIN